MSKKEYRQFLRYVFHEYVRGQVARASDYLDGPGGRRSNNEVESLRRATHILRTIGEFGDDNGDVPITFTAEGLNRFIGDLESGVRFNNRLLEQSGFMDALDAHFEELVDGLRFEHLPGQEIELLRSFGNIDPELELRGQIYLLKARRNRQERHFNELTVSERLKRLEQQLSEARLELTPQAKARTNAPSKPRRWFKGLGQIGQGAALSIGNVALAVGALHFPVSPETQTWGAVASVTTGVGMIFTGVGEFKSE